MTPILTLPQVRERQDPELLALDTDTVLFEDPGFKCAHSASAEDEPAPVKCKMSFPADAICVAGRWTSMRRCRTAS